MNSLIEYRCGCGKLLCKGLLLTGGLEIKCRRCGALTSLDGMNGRISGDNRYAFTIDRGARIVNCSDSAHGFLGYTRAELLSSQISDIDPALQSNEYGNLWEKIKREQKPFLLDSWHYAKDGGSIPVKILMQIFRMENKEYVCAMVDRLDAGELTKESRTLPGVAGGDSDLVAEVTPRGIYTYVGPGASALLGYTSGEILGKSLFDFYAPHEADKKKGEFDTFSSGRHPFRILNNAMRHKNGHAVPLETYFMPRYDDSGSFTGYGTMSWDVRAVKKISSQSA